MFTADKIGEPDARCCAFRRAEAVVRRCAAGPDHDRPRPCEAATRQPVPTGCTPICAPSIVTRSVRPAGTTWCSRTSACRTSSGNCRASSAESRNAQAGTGQAGHDVAGNTTRRFPIWSASWSGWASRCRSSARRWASSFWPSWLVLFVFAYALKKEYWKDITNPLNGSADGIAGLAPRPQPRCRISF
jgi:hypothetical protein